MKHARLLRWRASRFAIAPSAEQLADALSVEGIGKEPVPLYDAIRAFRKLRRDQRVAACRRYLEARR